MVLCLPLIIIGILGVFPEFAFANFGSFEGFKVKRAI